MTEQAQPKTNEPEQTNEPSPTEKLRDRDPVNSYVAVPGAQDPDSEIKDEVNPNTE